MPITARCDHCQGSGRFDGARCIACRGIGSAATWGDLTLTFTFPIDRSAVRGRRIERRVRAVVVILAFLFAALLLALAVLLIVGERSVRMVDAVRAGLALLLALAASSSAVRAAERERPVPPQQPSAPDPVLAPAPAWETIGRSLHVNVARSLAPDARAALEQAGTIAARLQHAAVTPLHLLAGIVTVPAGAAPFVRLGVDFGGLKDRLRRALGHLDTFVRPTVLDATTVDAVCSAYVATARMKRGAVGILDVLTALSAEEGAVRDILDDLGIPHAHVVNVAAWLRASDTLRERVRSYRARASLRGRHGMDRAMTAIATPILDAFGEDLTQLAARGSLGPIVGRDREFREILRILESGRRGVVIVGEPGVGKDAIVEGIAERMAADDVPAVLRDKRLVRLSVARLTSGAAPALAQERLLAALHEVARAGNIVLAVDQVEHLVGVTAGGEAAMDLGDVLETELERGGALLVATTTPDAYRRHVERTSLGGLLERVPLAEPEGDDAVQIVEVRALPVEARQRVFFSYGAIAACVELSHRYLHDRNLPEKAVALLDEVAAMVRSARGERAVIAREDVARLIEEKTGVPATEVTADEASKLLHLEERLHERVVGQEEAVRAVAAALRRARVDLRSGKRPIAAFLFLGPTGVGKTELAKAVAATFFGSEDAMVRLDMSEYQDPSSIARLIGASPGYAGSEAGGQLTEALRRNPFTLVLLDELEKAHPDVLNLFLQLLDDGRLTDSSGRTVDGTNAIIIATSNAGSPFIQESVAAGRPVEEIKRALLERELRGVFRPEFLNRFDGVIVFSPLDLAAVTRIARIMLAGVARQLEAKGIHFRITDAAVDELAAAGFDPQYGARPLRRAIQERVQDALASFLLQHRIGRRDTAVLDAGGTITIEQAPEI